MEVSIKFMWSVFGLAVKCLFFGRKDWFVFIYLPFTAVCFSKKLD